MSSARPMSAWDLLSIFAGGVVVGSGAVTLLGNSVSPVAVALIVVPALAVQSYSIFMRVRDESSRREGGRK